MSVMLGLNPAGAADYALKHLDWKRFPEFRDQRQALCDALVAAQVDYLHACGALDDTGDTGEGEYDEAAAAALKEKFCAALDNDLNTSLAVTALYDVLKYKTNDATKLAVIGDFDRVLSLSLIEKAAKKREELKKEQLSGGFTIISESGEADAEVEAKIQARQDAKKAKNYAEADRIRDELKAAGIEVTDIPHGAKWKRI